MQLLHNLFFFTSRYINMLRIFIKELMHVTFIIPNPRDGFYFFKYDKM